MYLEKNRETREERRGNGRQDYKGPQDTGASESGVDGRNETLRFLRES